SPQQEGGSHGHGSGVGTQDPRAEPQSDRSPLPQQLDLGVGEATLRSGNYRRSLGIPTRQVLGEGRLSGRITDEDPSLEEQVYQWDGNGHRGDQGPPALAGGLPGDPPEPR